MPRIIQSICLSIVRGTRVRRSMFLSIFQSGPVRGSSAIVFFEYFVVFVNIFNAFWESTDQNLENTAVFSMLSVSRYEKSLKILRNTTNY